MGLLEQQMAERRARILTAARELIAARGYAGLTMRELARASRVSVPTLYNLFGGKQALLVGELEETFARMVEGVERAAGRGVVQRAFSGCAAVNRDLRAVPRYTRELMHVLLVSEESRRLRRDMAHRYIAVTAESLRNGQSDGEIEAWSDPHAVATAIYEHYTRIAESWALGELDDAGFEAATRYGLALLMLGVARGGARTALERRVRALQRRVAALYRTAPRKDRPARARGASRRQR